MSDLLKLLTDVATAVYDSRDFDMAFERDVKDDVGRATHGKAANSKSILRSAPTYERVIGDKLEDAPKARELPFRD